MGLKIIQMFILDDPLPEIFETLLTELLQTENEDFSDTMQSKFVLPW